MPASTPRSSSLVSVIMPAYNAGRWIAAAIDSALTQTHEEVEVVVVDDGSTDGTREQVRAAAERDPRVRLLLQSRGGPAAARNHALTHARGDYVQYLDADDLIAPEKFAAQIARLRAMGEEGWVASARWGMFVDDPAATEFRPERLWRDYEAVDWMLACWEGGGVMPINTFLIPRAVCDAAGPWETSFRIAEDAEYFTRLVLRSRGVAFCPDATAYVRVGHPSRSSDVSEASLRSEYRALELITGRLLAVEESARTRRAAAHMLQRFAYRHYPRVKDLVDSAEQRAAALGGSSEMPSGGALFRAASRIVGWKAARWLQYARRKVRA